MSPIEVVLSTAELELVLDRTLRRALYALDQLYTLDPSSEHGDNSFQA